MKKLIIILMTLSLKVNAQNSILVELSEPYELSNIILALTKYGKEDPWEVLKNTKYYQEVLAYFAPVKNHPLLDSVNFSREKWESYLSFRTDAYAFEFDKNNKLKRKFEFFSVEGFAPFDQHIALINDFVKKSGFRNFYKQHKGYYDTIVQNYKEGYFIDKMVKFLNEKIGAPQRYQKGGFKMAIVLSPLVNRMNCHRNNESMAVDFPALSPELANGIVATDLTSRLNGNHMVFTEMDHGYINPISDKYEQLILENFDPPLWNKNSGYTGTDVFNEYMTWAVYDLFVHEEFPEMADTVSMRWQYQNATRGFYAQNLFAKKLMALYNEKGSENFEAIYEPLLKWCKEIENKVTLPTLLNVDFSNFIPVDINNIQLDFSEKMNEKLPFDIVVIEFVNGKPTRNSQLVTIKSFKSINEGKTIVFALDCMYKEFGIALTFQENMHPITSQSGIFLAPESYILLKKVATNQ